VYPNENLNDKLPLSLMLCLKYIGREPKFYISPSFKQCDMTYISPIYFNIIIENFYDKSYYHCHSLNKYPVKITTRNMSNLNSLNKAEFTTPIKQLTPN
jgi:hypothetical protein